MNVRLLVGLYSGISGKSYQEVKGRLSWVLGGLSQQIHQHTLAVSCVSSDKVASLTDSFSSVVSKDNRVGSGARVERIKATPSDCAFILRRLCFRLSFPKDASDTPLLGEPRLGELSTDSDCPRVGDPRLLDSVIPRDASDTPLLWELTTDSDCPRVGDPRLGEPNTGKF